MADGDTRHSLKVEARGLPEALRAALAERFGERFSTAMAVREHHGRDESPFPVIPPEAVVFAESNDDVMAVVRLCRAHRVPVIPFGAGSSVEGQLLAVRGGVSLDLSRMNRLLDIRPEDLAFAKMPPLPPGTEIADVEVVIRLRRRS